MEDKESGIWVRVRVTVYNAYRSLGSVDVDRLGGRRERQQRGPQLFFRYDAAV